MADLIPTFEQFYNESEKSPEERLVDAALVKLQEPIEKLIDAGVNIDYVDKKSGYSALHNAVSTNNLKLVEYLCSKGANVNIRGQFGDTPAMLAAYHGHVEILKYLVTKGADKNVKNYDGYNLLHEAISGGHIKMIDYVVSVLKVNPLDVNSAGDPPIHQVLATDNSSLLKYLMSRYKDILTSLEIRGSRGMTLKAKAEDLGKKKILDILK